MSDKGIDGGSDSAIGIEFLDIKKLQRIQDLFINKQESIFNKHSQLMKSVGGKGGTALSNKLVVVGETQIQLQRLMLERLGQITLNTANKNMTDLMSAQKKLIKDITSKTSVANFGADGGDSNGSNSLGGRLKSMLSGLFSGLKSLFKGLQKVWNKTAGALFKKTGSMGINKLLGLGGATIVGALIGKMISSSPLLQAMFKIMNTSLTLILRPIGDFFGAFLRPMSIYFLKEVAIPFFKKSGDFMKMGEQWGKSALGFFINPGKAIQSAVVLAFKDVGWPFTPKDESIAEAKWFQQDPGGVKRWMSGVNDMEGRETLTPDTGEFGFSSLGLGGLTWKQYQNAIGKGTATVSQEDFESQFDWGAWAQGLWDDSLTKRFFDWLASLELLPGAAADTGEGIDDMGDSLDDWGDAWDNFVNDIDQGARDWGRGISRWADEQATAWGNWTKEIEKDTQSWLEWAQGGLEGAWEWITNFGKVNEAFADSGKENEKAQASLTDNFWSWVESIKVAIFGTQVATNAFNDTIITAGDKISTAADIATGGIFTGSGHGRDTPAGTSERPWDPLTGLLNLATGQNNPAGTVLGGAFGDPTPGPMYTSAKPDDVGHSNLLGEYSDTRFESSPGKFVDIYSKGEKVDPNSEEGKIIQGIYQKQHDSKIANEAQQATMAKVKTEVTTADAGKAYILAGGGEAGLAAVEFAKAEGLSMTDYGDIVSLADKFGLKDHPMISTAREGLAAKIAMAEKIMQQRIDAGQTPSIQGDMLGLFPDAEDSTTGYKSGKVSESVKAAQQNLSDTFGITTYNPDGSVSTTPSDDSGSDDSSGGGGGGNNNVGGTDNTGDGGGWNTGLEGQGVVSNSASVSNPTGNAGGPAAAARAAGYSRGNRRHAQFGGIIDEPIIGVGMHSGDEWRLGETQKEIVTPVGAVGSDGNFYSINIHVGNITKEADYMKLKPLIQRWILEASSRRGMV